MRHPTSVFVRFLSYLIPMLVTTFIGLFLIFEYLEYQSSMERLDEEISTAVATSSLLIAEATYKHNIRDIRLALAATLANPNIAGLTVIDRTGDILDAFGLPPEDPDCITKKIGINFTEGASVLKVGELYVCYQDKYLIAGFYQRVLYVSLLALLLVSLAIASAFIAYRRTIGIPLTRLHQRILSRVEHGRHEPVEWQSNDEIGRVISEYNRMQASITEQEEALHAHKNTLEEELNQAHKMEAIGRLAGGIAHDFNNLLTAIIGFTHIAQMKLSNRDEDVCHDLEQVMETSKRAATLTDQLLTFSRKQFVDPSLLNLNTIVEGTQNLLARIIREDISISTDLGNNTAPIEADKSQIEQILLNLAINASDAMPNGGEIRISTGTFVPQDTKAETVELPSGDYTVLRFQDNGSGIEETELHTIFEPFYTTKDRIGSAGLGLSTVYGIVKQSGGYIYVDSELKKGTTFSIYFPAQLGDVHPELPLPDKQRSTSNTGSTVIVAEDDDYVRELVSKVLSNSGYQVHVVASGDAAIDLADHHPNPIDLLITDVIMPSMNGNDLAAKLQLEQPNLRVLYISGYTDDIRVESLGAVNFLRKPFSPDELARKVEEVMGINNHSPALKSEAGI